MKFSKIVISAVVLLIQTTGALAQSNDKAATEMFPFVLPWDDGASGVVTNVSFLNAKPAGVNGYIVPKNGQFVEAKTGRRVRFVATNFAARAAFPSHADAEKVAARIAKLGINLVRMHHMDNSNWGQDQSIWDYSFKDRQHISSAQLDRLDYLIFQLKKNGVYVNLNLHVSRQFSDADGFPASVNAITYGFDKRVDEFDRKMIQLQKNYAHDLLTHVNPYTGLAYTADPAIAVVEINNENSLVGDPWANMGGDLDTMPNPFRSELVGFWNDWLIKKYHDDATLQTAWLKGVTPVGPGLLTAKANWSFEHQGTSLADLVTVDRSANSESAGAPDIKVDVSRIDGTDWHVQVHQTGLDLKNGSTYTVSFRAKADRDCSVSVGAGLDQADWHNIGLNENAQVGTEWKRFHYAFTAEDIVPNHCRVALVLGKQTGTVWIAELQIHAGAEGAGLQAGQSLSTKSIEMPQSALRAQHADWIAFLADTERAYAQEMRSYLKSDLKVHANVICSQISWGGLTGVRREADMDFADNHAYWQHPSFPHKPWDSNDWNIPNTSMIADLAGGGEGTLAGLAAYRVNGKPYTVSEYNHPAPNDYRAETVPLIFLFAAMQDWDAIYLFDYGDYGTGVDNERINGYFGIGSDPAKTAFLPAAAMLFRAMEIPADTAAESVKVGGVTLLSGTAQALWKGRWEAELASGFRTRLGLDLSNDSGSRSPNPDKNDSQLEVHVGKGTENRTVTAVGEKALCAIGFVGGKAINLGGNELVFPLFGNNFAALTLTSMDSQPLQTSSHLLLTVMGRVENQGMVWNSDRTSVGSQWGHGPTVTEGIPATISLKTTELHHVWALDGIGKRKAEVPVTVENGVLKFTLTAATKSVWYEIGK